MANRFLSNNFFGTGSTLLQRVKPVFIYSAKSLALAQRYKIKVILQRCVMSKSGTPYAAHTAISFHFRWIIANQACNTKNTTVCSKIHKHAITFHPSM